MTAVDRDLGRFSHLESAASIPLRPEPSIAGLATESK